MTTSKRYDFRPATMSDLELLGKWQKKPHVLEWWDDDDPYDEEELADPRVARWIVQVNGSPFAYMQDYAVHGWGEHHFNYLPVGSRGIDQYIGERDMIGVGHGSGFIRQHMAKLFNAGVPVIGADPNPGNLRAIAVYKKLGFRVAGSELHTKWGTVLPMEAWLL